MKKATLAAIILAAVACFTAPAGQLLPEEKPISFNVPSYGPLAEEAFNLGTPPSYGRESEENFSFDINKFTHCFHFTRLWWFRDQLYYARQSRDEKVLEDAQEAFDVELAKVMNDILWLGAPRELVTLDEPE